MNTNVVVLTSLGASIVTILGAIITAIRWLLSRRRTSQPRQAPPFSPATNPASGSPYMMPNAASEDVPYYHNAPPPASPNVPPVAQPVTTAPAKKRTTGCLPVALFVIGLLLAAPSLSKLTSQPQNTGGSFNYAPLPTDISTPTPTDTPTPPTWKASASARFGPSYGYEYASPGNYFEWVDFKIENQSSETQGFQASDFSLCDTSGTCWNMSSISPQGPYSVPAGYQQNVEVAWMIPCGVTQFRTSFQPEGNPNTYWDWHNSFTNCP